MWLDADPSTPADRKYAMAAVFSAQHYSAYSILYSSDGIHWNLALNRTGPIEDRSSVFLNPMRAPRKWVFSIKSGPPGFGRSRSYWESDQLDTGAQWTDKCSDIVYVAAWDGMDDCMWPHVT